jgi:hypothetical protein
MSNELLSAGPPPLTQIAADSALELIDFMAAVVRGVDTIDVTPQVRDAWRAYLAENYPMLGPPDRYWFATAHITLATIQGSWSQMPPEQQAVYRQAWANALPGMLQFVTPALQAGAAAAAVPSGMIAAHIEQQQAPAAPALSASDAAQLELQRQRTTTGMLTGMSTMMANNTITMMHAMSGRPY